MSKVVDSFSPRLFKAFALWLRRYFRRNFDGVRLGRGGEPPTLGDEPVVLYTNHPSWWDPIHFMLLASLLFPERRLFGPFDAEALEKYGFFRRLGGFGVDRSPAGTRHFLKTSREILETPGTLLLVTAQGTFKDVRTRPVALRPGVAHLVRRMKRGLVVPLAVEYPFWDERLPEALSFFGAPFHIEEEGDASVEAWNARLAERLGETMERLAERAASRDASAFTSLLAGRSGVGGSYDLWRRLKAILAGRRFDPSHGGPRR